MKLEQRTGLTLDLTKRFKRETRGFPRRIRLSGNPMHCAIAEQLLKKYTPHIEIADDGEEVQLMSLERHGSAFLALFLKNEPPPTGRFLLHTIPEDMLIKYAERQHISIVREEKDDVRIMLDKIAEQQPQTFFSLARSAERLADHLK